MTRKAPESDAPVTIELCNERFRSIRRVIATWAMIGSLVIAAVFSLAWAATKDATAVERALGDEINVVRVDVEKLKVESAEREKAASARERSALLREQKLEAWLTRLEKKLDDALNRKD